MSQLKPLTVATQPVRSLLNYIVGLGHDREKILLAAGIDPAHLNDSTYYYPGEQYIRLFEVGAEHTDDAWFGHHYGLAVEPERWGVMGYISVNCHNGREALAAQRRYQLLIGSIGEPVLHEREGMGILEWRADPRANRHMAEEVMASWGQFGRSISGQDLPATRVTFCHAAAAAADELEGYYRCPVEFEADMNALYLPVAYLDLPFRNPDPVMANALQQQADALLSRLDADVEPRYRLRRYLVQTLPDHVPELQELAEQLHVGVRTLQRRFTEWGTTYKDFVDETRREMALDYLDHGGSNMLELTFMVGYSDQSAFQRAFRRWTGTTPRRYQKESKAS